MAIDSTFFDLATERMGRIESELHNSSLIGPFVRRLSFAWFDHFNARVVDKMTKSMRDDTIWFRGAADELRNSSNDAAGIESYPSLDDMFKHIEGMKHGMLRRHGDFLNLAAIAKRHGKISAAATNAAAAACDLFDAMESFRWALMDIEANHAHISEGYSATNAAELEAVFDRIASEG
ncbi:hypothetical protein RD110_07925 [Rhodoferax koreense]|uniref:Uncharacterized protein n=2 Tax=Rhodoferax koreensis TaxID=1842727 RepID=A0A1P8JTV8_9BURK|nr:hypothetical protein RD110_07925 [Rhodoferax koreense]